MRGTGIPCSCSNAERVWKALLRSRCGGLSINTSVRLAVCNRKNCRWLASTRSGDTREILPSVACRCAWHQAWIGADRGFSCTLRIITGCGIHYHGLWSLIGVYQTPVRPPCFFLLCSACSLSAVQLLREPRIPRKSKLGCRKRVGVIRAIQPGMGRAGCAKKGCKGVCRTGRRVQPRNRARSHLPRPQPCHRPPLSLAPRQTLPRRRAKACCGIRLAPASKTTSLTPVQANLREGRLQRLG